MDLTTTTAPRSDQLNFDDVAASPMTITVAEVRAGTDEQPVEIHTVETPGRPFKPSKTVRRLLVAAWGRDGDAYAGRRMTLYGDPDITFGRERVGGIRVSHLSHIDKPLTVALTATRGKRAKHTVQPLTEAPRPAPTFEHEPTEAQVAECTDDADLRAWWPVSSPERQAQIKARAAELKGVAS